MGELERVRFELESLQHVMALKASETKELRTRTGTLEQQLANLTTVRGRV